MSKLKRARDRIELVRLMQNEVPYDCQDRGLMRDELNLAIHELESQLFDMETVDELKGVKQ